MRSAFGAAPIASGLSNETCESIEDVLPRWMFVSMNLDAAKSVLPSDKRNEAVQLMQDPTSGGDRFWDTRYLSHLQQPC